MNTVQPHHKHGKDQCQEDDAKDQIVQVGCAMRQYDSVLGLQQHGISKGVQRLQQLEIQPRQILVHMLCGH